MGFTRLAAWRDHVEVVDELRQVLDGVDVVVRRRADERHAGLRPPQVGDVRRHLGAAVHVSIVTV